MKAVGKNIAQHVYVHFSAINELDSSRQKWIEEASNLARIRIGKDFNVIKLSQDSSRLTLLDYPDFFNDAFPVLHRYWTVDLDAHSVKFRSYRDSFNPPLLHRKELLLATNHPQYEVFSTLTAAAEQIGLFEDTVRIGFKQAWDALLAQRGYRIVGHELVPIGNDESESADGVEECVANSPVQRHRTALTRYGFSAPIQTLARFGFLDGSKTLFDYGCGRGDDLRGLRENGIAAIGWDPHYAADEIKRSAHLVNLGFVINVIEDPEERLAALQGAYHLTEELLVVSAMLANPEALRGKPYGDGVLTARNTFQKYYTQGELRAYLAESLNEEPIPVGPGIFYIFKDQDAEQRFMLERQVNRRNLLRITQSVRSVIRPEKMPQRDKAQEKYDQHRHLLDVLWNLCLTLGREADRSEVANANEITAAFGSIPAALRFIKSHQPKADTLLEQARRSRIDDLHVYFAQWQFERRKPYRHLENRLQKDVKAFFGDYPAALQAGRELLFAAGQPEAIAKACREAAECGVGWLEEEEESLQLPTDLIVQLPAILRTYVSCGLRLYGDAGGADLLKVHSRSGKLTLMRFDDFVGNPLPRLIQRIKINLRTQDLEIFDYGTVYTPPYLYRKSRFINEEFPNYAEQLAFDEALDSLNLFDLSGYGPKPEAFDADLAHARWAIDHFQLVRSQTIPDLDASCGRFFTYRQLIECGETQARTGLANLPKQPDTYTALHELATHILDPVIDYYGMVQLIYGFCAPELARLILGRIAPKLDQHAACEQNRLGKPICSRLGAAVDFLVEDEDMIEVGRWIAQTLPFDRMYLYGPDKPLHLSYGPEQTRQVTLMLLRGQEGRLVPSSITVERLLSLDWSGLTKNG
ncbi:Peptidase M15 [Gammaproteobacteria bacterium]